MFRVMQQEEDGHHRVNNRGSIRSGENIEERSEAPTKPASPGPAAAVAVVKAID
jgi:hypothetical protein